MAADEDHIFEYTDYSTLGDFAHEIIQLIKQDCQALNSEAIFPQRRSQLPVGRVFEHVRNELLLLDQIRSLHKIGNTTDLTMSSLITLFLGRLELFLGVRQRHEPGLPLLRKVHRYEKRQPTPKLNFSLKFQQ